MTHLKPDFQDPENESFISISEDELVSVQGGASLYVDGIYWGEIPNLWLPIIC